VVKTCQSQKAWHKERGTGGEHRPAKTSLVAWKKWEMGCPWSPKKASLVGPWGSAEIPANERIGWKCKDTKKGDGRLPKTNSNES